MYVCIHKRTYEEKQNVSENDPPIIIIFWIGYVYVYAYTNRNDQFNRLPFINMNKRRK